MHERIRKKPSEMTVAEQFVAKVERESRSSSIRVYAPMILLVILTIGFSIYNPRFFSKENVANILGTAAVPLILATGLTFVLLVGRIDLSVEGVMGLVGSCIALLMLNNRNANDWGLLGLFLPILVGVLIGVITGFLHVKLKIASFIITYAVSTIASGVGVLLYNSKPATIKVAWIEKWSMTSFLNVPVITWIAIAFFLICCVILNYTAFGRAVYAIGDNEAAARASGINVDRVVIGVFTLSALAASLAGFVALVRLKFGSVDLGKDQMFPCITALVVGGTSLSGGKGGMLQTIVGTLIYLELNNFLTIIRVNTDYRPAVLGVIIIIAVILTTTRDRKMINK